MADIFRRHAADYPYPLSTCQSRVLAAVQACRTARLGGHAERCSLCDFQRIAYNSCRNRHCPKCQFLAKARWVEKRIEDLLPVPYFHLVFTVPQPIAQIALQNRQVVYNILFRASSETLMKIAADPKHLGAQIGFVAVLHTWGQNLHHHPHLHCVVPGGGLSPDDTRWVAAKPGFFLPVRVLSRLFRRRFLEWLTEAYNRKILGFHGELASLRTRKAFEVFLADARRTEWVVYSKRPFGGAEHVVAYLGRYTHRVAISNDRLQRLENGSVTFAWKDYRRPRAGATLTLGAHEFMRRFLLHTLPRGFVRLRHYGLLANKKRGAKLERCFQLLCPARAPRPSTPKTDLDWKALYQKLTGKAIDACPKCPGQMSEAEPIPTATERIEKLGQPGGLVLTSVLSQILTQRFLLETELLRQELDRIDSS